MGRTLFTVAAAAALVLLTACGAKPTADPPATTTSAPTTATSPTPPVMPALAKEHTKAGAEAFVQYYWDVVNYSTVTFDTAPLEAIEAGGCTGCNRALETIRADKAAGVVVHGGAIKPSEIEATWQRAGVRKFVIVSFALTSQPELIDYPSPTADKSYSGGASSLKLRLDPSRGGWSVTEWNPIG